MLRLADVGLRCGRIVTTPGSRRVIGHGLNAAIFRIGLQANILPHHPDADLQRRRQGVVLPLRNPQDAAHDSHEPMPCTTKAIGRGRRINLLERFLELRIAERFGDELINVRHAVHAFELSALGDMLKKLFHLHGSHSAL